MFNLNKLGLVRVGAAIPQLEIGNPEYNIQEIIKLTTTAVNKYGVKVLVFPELSITAYTCADLFQQQVLLNSAQEALEKLLTALTELDVIVAVGMPLEVDNQLFNCAVLLSRGRILGVVPKTFIPNYNEFYEKRWFASAKNRISKEITLCGQTVPFGENILFKEKLSGLCIGVEICEDLWAPIPPSSYHALHGANLILNLSASNDIVAKDKYRRELVQQQSARCICGYLYTSAGQTESTTDLVFGGHALLAENGFIAEELRFPDNSSFIYYDLDLEKIKNERRKQTSFMEKLDNINYQQVEFQLSETLVDNLKRRIDPHPFVPSLPQERNARCKEIFRIQSTGLVQRLSKTGIKKAVIGVSGGLDSTLALLVSVEAFERINMPKENIIGITMPGFGTTDRTYANALKLMKELGITVREISIRKGAIQELEDIGHSLSARDVTYENVQARKRTAILMDTANKEGGLVVGTGDLSELALGWCTYNGDHMSMYAVNVSIPKTLVRYLVQWYAQTTNNKRIAEILTDIYQTPVSPELLPPDKEGRITQKTEDLIGAYELHDFFLYNMIRYGYSPSKIYTLAVIAFREKYEPQTILRWLKTFYRRFFTQQFKRSCLPDGPKVGSICLSPRGDWRMPSDASYKIWLSELEQIELAE